MRLAAIMSSPVETVSFDGTVEEARERMRRLRLHHLVVMDGASVVGVVSARDLIGAPGAQPIEERLGGDVVTGDPAMTVRECANKLRGRSIGCLPVVERGRVVGIVTVSDLLELLGKGAEKPAERGIRWTMKGRGSRREKRRQLAPRRSP